MKYFWILIAAFMFVPVFADTDIEPDDGDIEVTDDYADEEELPDEDFSLEEDGAGLSITTAVNGSTVIYGRVFYNYITDYSRGRIYIYEQIGETDEFALAGQIPSDREKTSYFGGYVGMSENTIFTLNAVYASSTTNEKQLDIYKKDEESVWSHHKTVELPENYGVTGKGFAADNGNVLLPVYNTVINDKSIPELFLYSSDDDYVLYKSIAPANYDKDLYGFSFPMGFDISDNTIVATSTSMKDEFTYGPTSIHIFSKDPESGEWSETQTIKSDSGDLVKAYYNISIFKDRFIVHSYLDENLTQGSAQIFQNREGTWELVKEILPPEDAKNHFGYNVSMGEDFAVATDKGNSKSLPYGTTYVFYKDYSPETPDAKAEDNWGLFKRFEVSDESVAPLMGSVAVIDGDTLSMGAAPTILKSGAPMTPYIEKLETPKFSSETPDESEVNDEKETNSDSDSVEETTDTENKDKEEKSSGCSVMVF